MDADPETLAARDAYLNVVRVHEMLAAEFAELFREHGITQPQFNVLRILRGAGKAGATCRTIGDELLNRVPDVTRLIDRMESAGLVVRERSDTDRRVVRVRLTPKGRRLCDSLDEPVLDLHRRQLEHLSSSQVETLNRGLRRVLARD